MMYKILYSGKYEAKTVKGEWELIKDSTHVMVFTLEGERFFNIGCIILLDEKD